MCCGWNVYLQITWTALLEPISFALFSPVKRAWKKPYAMPIPVHCSTTCVLFSKKNPLNEILSHRLEHHEAENDMKNSYIFFYAIKPDRPITAATTIAGKTLIQTDLSMHEHSCQLYVFSIYLLFSWLTSISALFFCFSSYSHFLKQS